MVELPFDQIFVPGDLFVIAVLVVLEGTLSIDNALVLGLLAKRLPPQYRKKALTYGLVGAFVFRFAAIGFAAWLLQYPIVKLFGGAYLIYVAVKHFFFDEHHDDDEKSHVRLGPDGHPIIEDETADLPADLTPEQREAEIAKRSPIPETVDPSKPPEISPGKVLRKYAKFWPTVFIIEMTDIAFAVDSILAAMAFIPKPPADAAVNPKLWVVLLGGFIGVILMRFAAVIFIRMLEKFPRFETAAYLLVTVIGLKLVADWTGNHFLATPENDHPINFHDVRSPAFWIFWTLMVVCFAIGFIRKKDAGSTH